MFDKAGVTKIHDCGGISEGNCGNFDFADVCISMRIMFQQKDISKIYFVTSGYYEKWNMTFFFAFRIQKTFKNTNKNDVMTS